MRPSIGLHFFWNNTFVTGNRFTADAAWGGSDWIAIAVGDRYQIHRTEAVSIQAFWNRRPDTLFYGIGPESLDSNRSRVGSDVVGGTLGYEKTLGRLALTSNLGIRRTVFRDYTCCSDPSLQDRVEAGQLPPPPGFQENTTAAQLSLKAVLDTRPTRPTAADRLPHRCHRRPLGRRHPGFRPLVGPLRCREWRGRSTSPGRPGS